MKAKKKDEDTHDMKAKRSQISWVMKDEDTHDMKAKRSQISWVMRWTLPNRRRNAPN